MSEGNRKNSASKILWVDLSRDANMIDGFYREETRLQENSARLKAAQSALVEVSEMGKEEAEDVLKPESLEESSPSKPLHRRRWGRRRRRLKIAKTVSSSSSSEPRKRRPYRRRNRSELLLLTSPRPLYEKRQRKIPRGFDDYESFFDTSRPTEDEDTGDSMACFACGKSFLPTTLEAHVRQIHRRFPKDQCYICGKFFPTADNARIHIKTAHYGIYNYKCPECDKGYYYYLKLVRHLRSLHQCDSPPSREECRVDGAFLNNANVDLDSRELRENECRCLVCLSIFPLAEMSKHMNERHRAFPRTRCYICGQRFLSTQEVFEHLESTHLKPSMFTCPECETGFDELQEWRDHMEKVHQSETLYKCEQCGKVFGWKKFLRQHIRREHVGDGSGSVFAMRNDFRAEKTTLQEECDRQKRLIAEAEAKTAEAVAEPETRAIETAADVPNGTEEDSSLNNPECNEPSTLVSGRSNVMDYEYELAGGYENPGETDEATGDELKGQKKSISIDFFEASRVDICPLCKKALHTKKSLKTHIEAIHHKMKRYSCNLCDRSFYARCDLRKHIDCVHNRFKTYSCNECGRRFFLHSQLASHLVNHHKAILPFKCNECGRRYAIKQVLNDHVWHKPKRIRINGRLVTPNPFTMPKLIQALSPSKTQIQNQSIISAHRLSGSPVEPTEVAIFGGNGDVKEVYLIGNQLYFAENVAFPVTSLGADGNPVYEPIHLDGSCGGGGAFTQTAVAFQSSESSAFGTAPLGNGENQIIALDMENGAEPLLRSEDLGGEQTLNTEYDRGYTVLTTSLGESLDTNNVVVHQFPLSITEDVNCKAASIGDVGHPETAYFTYQQS
ncbi:Zinc finger protein 600 [Echinococcus granulosus]|uniref:Zinc finger protein 600 n=1 Tax=Echinococcus granulosus TaxID=6210 RepID=W6UC21_ECHGR|nr:Zinc finger protein 600 [Echinococcus granulosus]EUB58111.1 Zinc finger protein 600 [Echinococcus granulosus]